MGSLLHDSSLLQGRADERVLAAFQREHDAAHAAGNIGQLVEVNHDASEN